MHILRIIEISSSYIFVRDTSYENESINEKTRPVERRI